MFVITRIVKPEADDSKLWNDDYIIVNHDTYIDYYSLFDGDIVVSSLPNLIGSCYISASIYDLLNESKDYSITVLQYDLEYDVNGQSKYGPTLGTATYFVDQDVCFVDYPTIIRERQFNGF